MKTTILSLFSLLLLVTRVAVADQQLIPTADTAACMEGSLAEFGQYIGNWNIADRRLSQDGSEWSDGAGARWNFVCIGNGAAIQDFWIPNGGDVGTNLRTWNAETESWDIAWAIKSQPGFAHIQAKKNADGNIVMHYKSPQRDPPRRITFFPADSDGWSWKLEMSFDGGESWTEVYQIRATPAD